MISINTIYCQECIFSHHRNKHFSSGRGLLIDILNVSDKNCGSLVHLGALASEAAADTEGGDDDDNLERDEADQDQHYLGYVVRQFCHNRGDTTLQLIVS